MTVWVRLEFEHGGGYEVWFGLLAVALGWLIRRPWKGAVLFERHLERPQGPSSSLLKSAWGGLCVTVCVQRSWMCPEESELFLRLAWTWHGVGGGARR